MNPFRILFVLPQLPYKSDNSMISADGLRALNLIRGLASKGHQLDLLGFHNERHDRALGYLTTWCTNVHSVYSTTIDYHKQSRISQIGDTIVGAKHGYPRRVWQHHSPTMLRKFSDLVRTTSYDIIHFSVVGVAELLYELPVEQTSAKVFDLIDAVSLSIQSSLRHRIDITWPSRLIEWPMLRRFEMQMIDRVDAAILISSRDKAYLGNKSNAYVIPNGIDTTELSETTQKTYDIAFHGSLSAQTNSDAVLWFAHAVLPLIREKRPETTFVIIGRDPPSSVQDLASERIIVTGAVADISTYLRLAKVSVAPVRFGAGQKTKLLESFANAIPVVATHEANEGTGAVDGDSILLRDQPTEIAAAILELLNSESLREKVGLSGFRFVQQHYSWSRSISLLENVYKKALRL